MVRLTAANYRFAGATNLFQDQSRELSDTHTTGTLEHRGCTEKKRRTPTRHREVVLTPFGLPERFCYFAVDRESEWDFTFRSGEKR